MELTNEQFTQITGVSLAEAVYDGANERRQYPRVAFGSRAKILPVFDSFAGNGKRVLIRDISLKGIGFLCHDPMDIGDEFLIHLPTPSDKVIPVHCMVKRCEGGGTGGAQFIIGATFELVLNPVAATNDAPRPNIAPTPAAEETSTAVPPPDRSEDRGGYLTAAARSMAGFLSALKGERESSKIRNRLRSNDKDKRAEVQPAKEAAPQNKNKKVENPPTSMLGFAPDPQHPAPPRNGGLFIRASALTETPMTPQATPTVRISAQPLSAVNAVVARPAPEAPAPRPAPAPIEVPAAAMKVVQVPAPAPTPAMTPVAALAPIAAPAPIPTRASIAMPVMEPAPLPPLRPAIEAAVCAPPVNHAAPPKAEVPVSPAKESVEPTAAALAKIQTTAAQLQTAELEPKASADEEALVPSSAVLFAPIKGASTRSFAGPVAAHRHPRQRRRR